MTKLGVIGVGNMAKAMLSRLLDAGKVLPENLVIHDRNAHQSSAFAAQYGATVAQSNIMLVDTCDTVLLAVKPNACADVLTEIAPRMARKNLLSIVTGWSYDALRARLPQDTRCLRAMPNTPALVGAGATMLCAEHTLDAQTFGWVCDAFAAFGLVITLSESMMDAFIGISGSSPAYGFVFIEAMADAGVLHGLPRDVALRLAAQSLLGAASMVLQTGQHPGALKDAVCSPAGTTIEAVYALEKAGFRGAVMDCVHACAEKARMLREAHSEPGA